MNIITKLIFLTAAVVPTALFGQSVPPPELGPIVPPSDSPPQIFADSVLFDNLYITAPYSQFFLPSSNGTLSLFPIINAAESVLLNSITLNASFSGSAGYSVNIYNGTLLGVGDYLGSLSQSDIVVGGFYASAEIVMNPDSVYWIMPVTPNTPNSLSLWTTHTPFHLGAGDSAYLYANSDDQGASFSTIFDSYGVYLQMRVGVVSIPEPSTYGLIFAMPLFTWAIVKRRRK
jgi:hypothetical protein